MAGDLGELSDSAAAPAGADESVDPLVGQWIARVRGTGALDDAVVRIDEAIVAEVPYFAGDAGLTAELRENTRSQVEAFLVHIGDARQTHTPDGAVILARSFARRGLDLQDFLRVYRVGLRTAQDVLAQTVLPDSGLPPLPGEVAVQLMTRAGEWMDRAVDDLSAAFTAERQRWRSGPLARRIETVNTVLENRTRPDGAALSAALQYPLHKTHTALALWTGGHKLSDDELATTARIVAATAGATDHLWVPSAVDGALLWLADATDLTAEPGVLTAVLRPKRGQALTATAGTPAAGPDGFRLSHSEALAAQRVVLQARDAAPFTDFRNVELLHLLSQDRPALRRFVSSRLGELDAATDACERLRETLLLALTEGPTGAARTLGLHKNTVRYRVEQARSLIGRGRSCPETELVTALRCRSYFNYWNLTKGK